MNVVQLGWILRDRNEGKNQDQNAVHGDQRFHWGGYDLILSDDK